MASYMGPPAWQQQHSVSTVTLLDWTRLATDKVVRRGLLGSCAKLATWLAHLLFKQAKV
jgi:hypothetical protein